jgi:amidase
MESDSLYRETLSRLEAAGAEVIPFDPPEVELEGFLTLLNLDMREDLPAYLQGQIRDTVAVGVRSVADVVAFNRADSLLRVPYGQALLEGILADTTSEEAFEKVRSGLLADGRRFFTEPWEAHRLDAVLSVNNYHAGYAAVARYPALTVPMGYRESGEPTGLTFIGRPFQIPELLRLAHAFEQLGPERRVPAAYAE